MATDVEMKNGRIAGGSEMRRFGARTGVMLFEPKTYPGPGGAMMRIGSEYADGNSAMKVKAINQALNLLAAKGFTLPAIEFQCTATEGIPCVACIGNANGGRDYTIFMGPKTGQHNPQVMRNDVPGGMGKEPGRGIADQVYDGTQRWFGNPRMHSHATTVVIHEIGHILHEISDPSQFWTFKLGREINGENVKAANQGFCVSAYAMNNPLEFVAETFAGCMSGKSYSAAVMDFYRSIGGPFPPSGNF